jgi:anti-sigma factor RsiW
MTRSDERMLLVNAALDGELDAAGMIEIEAAMAADPALAAEYARLAALREAIGARLAPPRAPEALRAWAMAMGRPPARPAPRRLALASAPWRALAAALVVGVALGVAGDALFTARSGDDGVQRALVAGYVRGRLSGQPVDVASSDRHTVKPWLAGKVAAAATVIDLSAEGFSLVGGRVDVIAATPVATLIYQRREHQIALSELPTAGPASAPRASTREGYRLLEWSDGSRRFAAVSDLPLAELEAFGAAFRRAAAAEREAR